MPAVINNDRLELRADSLGYQAARVQLPAQPSTADTMVFYYKAWVEGWPVSTNEANTSYAWNGDAFFGLSFNGSVSANNGGIVGWTNQQGTTSAGNTISHTTYTSWRPSATTPFVFTNGGFNINALYYGSSTTSNFINTTYAGMPFPTNAVIGTSAVNSFLGIIKMQKVAANASNISISFGTNWEGLAQDNYTTALTSANTSWIVNNNAVQERSNFRPNWNSPSLSGTVVFPSWVVAKWVSGVPTRNLVIDSLRVEYYNGAELVGTVG
jgi:hypothetical protein